MSTMSHDKSNKHQYCFGFSKHWRTFKSDLFITRINNIINFTVRLRGSLSRLNSETVRALDQVTNSFYGCTCCTCWEQDKKLAKTDTLPRSDVISSAIRYAQMFREMLLECCNQESEWIVREIKLNVSGQDTSGFYCPLIGSEWSHDLDTGLSLVKIQVAFTVHSGGPRQDRGDLRRI